MEKINEIKEILSSSSKKIVIIPHRNPDGDAIGSTLGLSLFLKKKGHEVTVVSPNDFPKFLKWMPTAKSVVNAEFNKSLSIQKIEEAEILFLLDFNTLSRIDQLAELVDKSKAIKILIDHHQEPDSFDYMYSDVKMSSTCEMVYHFIDKLDETEKIDQDLATCLYVGLLTDTGNFKYPATTALTLKVASKLVEKGLVIHKIHHQLFDNSRPDKLKLLSAALSKMEALPEYRTTIFNLTKAEMLSHDYQRGDTDGFVNYGLSLKDYVFSILFIEDTQKDFIKISFRSKGDFDVNQLARKHFNGGGHINAAGGRSDLPMDETIAKLKTILTSYETALKNTEV